MSRAKNSARNNARNNASPIRPIRAWPSALRILLFLLCLVTLWGPVAWPLHRILGGQLGYRDVATAIALLLLYGLFIVLVQVWGRRVHRWQPTLRYLGLTGGWGNFLRRLAMAAGLGIVGVLLLFVIQGLCGWVTFRSPGQDWGTLLATAGVVGLAYGVLEELLFRGWLLAELETGGRSRTALLADRKRDVKGNSVTHPGHP